MKKLLGAASLLLTLVTVLSVPASAVAIITGDSFTSASKSGNWVTDRFDPEEFDISDGKLYLALGNRAITNTVLPIKRANITRSRVKSSSWARPPATPGPPL
jgi:hypothetical protein